MRDYSQFDQHLNHLRADIYPQPPDDGHNKWAQAAIATFHMYLSGHKSVLDVGCGSGFAEPMWAGMGMEWTGITLGRDADEAKSMGRPVYHMDMTFLEFDDDVFDVVFARHVLEHSPFPLITLMEWRRVARKYLLLVAPAPDHWGYRGKNHYSVMNQEQLVWLCARAGWQEVASQVMTNHNPEYLQVLPNENERRNARRVRPSLEVEYRYLLEVAEPEIE